MKLNKATIYFYDLNGDCPSSYFEEIIGRSDLSLHKFDEESVEIGEWYDDIPLNYHNCTKATCESFFTINTKLINEMVKDVNCLLECRHYVGLNQDEAIKLVIDKNKKLNEMELKHFMGQVENNY